LNGDGNHKGGAMNLYNSNVTVSNSNFTGNKAISGGAINFECTSLEKCSLVMNNSRMENNSASVKGGSIFYNYLKPALTGIFHKNNTAPYGNNYASYPVRIGLINSTMGDEIIFDNVGSGINLPDTVKFALLDHDDQITTLEASSQISITSINQSEARVEGNNVVQVINGVATFESLSAVATPGSRNLKFKISSKILRDKKIQQMNNITGTQPEVTMNFRF